MGSIQIEILGLVKANANGEFAMIVLSFIVVAILCYRFSLRLGR